MACRRALALFLLAGCAADGEVAPHRLDCGADPLDPLDHGRRRLGCALAAAHVGRLVEIGTVDEPAAAQALAASGATLATRAESYVLATIGDRTWAIGRDRVGAMYGAQDLLERLQRGGEAALELASPISAAPEVPIRAANLFLVLPARDEPVWWFLDEDFWREYLDHLAEARIDLLDLHGMYDLDNTLFPNALLYFATSASHPDVGAPVAERERNLEMLNRVIDLARARGIAVSLMSYHSDTHLDGRSGGVPLDDVALRRYTREASRDLATRAPGLARLGFRIGESGKDAAWWRDTFVAGVQSANSGVRLYTRNWGTSKPQVAALAQATDGDLIVEVKFNGEQLGAPYLIAGGMFTAPGWTNYQYENYLQPPSVGRVLFQVRTSSTHRAFRQASYQRARQTIASFTLGGAAGFTLEPPHAFFPQRDFLHHPDDRYSPWTWRRDELMMLLYGRLGYDPTTDENLFRRKLAERTGEPALWEAVQAASDVVPWIQEAHTCGPDTRDYAPELELAGPVGYWSSPPFGPPPRWACGHSGGGAIYHGPFDSAAVAGPFDAAADLLAGRPTARLDPLAIARRVLDDARAARAAAQVAIDPANREARDVVRECVALADLGEWFGHKLRAAFALAVYRGSAHADWLAAARVEVARADFAWRQLALDTGYLLPFWDWLRTSSDLDLKPYHWAYQVPRLDEDPASIDAVVAGVAARPPQFAGTLPAPGDVLDGVRDPGPGLVAIEADPPDGSAAEWRVTIRFGQTVPERAAVTLWWKPFASDRDWRPAPAARIGDRATALVAGGGRGALFAVEVRLPGGAWRYPDRALATPWVALPPR